MVRDIKLVCTENGCNAKRNIKFDETMPNDTYEVRSSCPKHSIDGDFHEEFYFDKNGRQIFHD